MKSRLQDCKITILLLFFCMISLLACTSSPDTDADEVCTKTSNDFQNVSGWLQLDIPSENLPLDSSPYLYEVAFFNEDFGIITEGNGNLHKTNSGGLCWGTIDTGSSSSFSNTFFLSKKLFYLSYGSRIYKTVDGGETFNRLGYIGITTGAIIYDMHFFNENEGINCQGSDVYKTIDGGKTWVNVYPRYGGSDNLQFVSNKVGYLYGGTRNNGFNYGEIHKTLDGGATWSKITSQPNITKARIRTLYFVNENLGYFANNLQEVFWTQNGGVTWTLRASVYQTFSDMVFVNQTLGYAIDGRIIYKTVDSGITWTKDYISTEPTGKSTVLTSITKTPNGSIFVVGINGTILKKEIN